VCASRPESVASNGQELVQAAGSAGDVTVRRRKSPVYVMRVEGMRHERVVLAGPVPQRGRTPRLEPSAEIT
jgi:hypothetical protein